MSSFKKAVLRNFPKLTGTHSYRSFFFNKSSRPKARLGSKENTGEEVG